jgi:hypothetical protein
LWAGNFILAALSSMATLSQQVEVWRVSGPLDELGVGF